MNPDGTAGGPRQAPMVCNDFSSGQPHCDKSNRWRQRILRIEERMLTKSFPLRFATTGLGIILVNTWSGWDYFVQHNKAGGLAFRGVVQVLCAEGLRSDLDRNDPRHGPSRPPDATAHDLVPLRSIVGWTGGKTPRCAECNFQCSTVCLQCSSATAVVACHFPQTMFKGKVSKHPCLGLHIRNPHDSKRTVASASKSQAAKRKHREKRGEQGSEHGSADDEEGGNEDDGDSDMD